MRNLSDLFRHVRQLASMLISLSVDAVCYLGLCLRPSPALAAENLFLRKQLALYQERHVKPRRVTNTIRLALIYLARWFDSHVPHPVHGDCYVRTFTPRI